MKRLPKCTVICAILLASFGAFAHAQDNNKNTIQETHEFVPQAAQEDKAKPLANGPSCFHNQASYTIYNSVRWNTGTINFVLGPGERHRLNNMSDTFQYCWDSQQIGASCRYWQYLTINNC